MENGAYGMEIKERIVELPCHGADLLRQMLRFGYQQDPRARKLLDWLVQVQGQDGVWPCISKLRPFSCIWATADVLRAYRDLPESWLTPQIEASHRQALEVLLESNIYQYGKGKPSPRWFNFGFPLQWDSDILEMLGLLAPFVGPDEAGIQASLAMVLEKQDNQGRWPCEKEAKGGRWMKKFVELEEIGKPSKWVTLHAMKMLKDLYREAA